MLNLCLVKLAFAQGIIHSVSSTYTFIFPELRFLVSQKHQIHDKMAMPDREIFSVYPQWWYFKQYVWCNPNYMTHSFKTETRVFQHVHQFDASVWSVLEILSNMTLWMHKKAKRTNKQKKTMLHLWQQQNTNLCADTSLMSVTGAMSLLMYNQERW